ncbi:related to nitrate assimilation regulatory protein nirA [Fusarium torulosum]|uniref:Related to nitrate assimilation regulatory protein nirA n=1 Tax=Fusarium torulosum TaxID=33205 RepID=A0AAE8SL46_9HYPO|nr:related to nitrate assimilation regulatory protein nirA [Fusarium torulosum]
MLELRKGSKDLLQALELLRTAPEDSVVAMLQDLRSKGSVSEFLQSVDSGTVATSSPVNPLATSLAETLADSRVELDLNMRYTGAFPSLETLQIADVDLSLLAAHKRPALTNQHTTMPSSPYSPLDLSSPSSGTPTPSEPWLTPSDATGGAGQRVDPRLEFLRVWQWTSVPVPDLLAAQAVSFYLVNEHPVLAFFDADLMIRDLVSGGRRFCSPLFVSSLLAWSCASYSQFEPRARSLSLAFLEEAEVRWNELQDYNSVTTLSSAMLLVLTCNQHGQDRVGLNYLDASAEIGLRLGLFGDKDSPMPDFNDEESRSAASFAAWGAFGWHSLHSINFRVEHQIRHPPSLPIPGDAAGLSLPDSMGSTFTWISKFWLIIHETFKDGYNNFSRQPMSNAHRMYHLLLDWADNLPEDAKRSDDCPHHVLVLHIWYHAAILDIWRPYLEARSDEYAAQDSDEYSAHEASAKQLKRLVYIYRTKFESTHQTMLITPGLLTLINEIFRKPDASDAQFWFIFAARGCLSIASWCKGLRGTTEGLMTLGSRNGTFKREGWADNSLVEDVRSTTRTLLQDGNYSSLYPINLNSVSENIEDIGMESLAGDFQRLNAQNEPRGKEAEVPSEQHIWKGDHRDLSLTLTEATEEEEYV